MPTLRLPLAASQIGTRNGSLSYDALLQNCIVEKTSTEEAGIVKRDAAVVTTTVTDVNAVSSIIPVGMWEFGGLVTWAYGYTTGPAYKIQIKQNPNSPSNLNLMTVALGEQNFPISASYDPIVGKYLFATATTAYDGASGTAITLPTATLAFGSAWLDGFFFIYGTDGKVYNSNLDDPRTWAALDSIKPQTDIGYPTRLTRYLNYIVTFGSTGYFGFFDAGNATGSPLSPVPNFTGQIGCASPYSVCTVGNSLLWLGRDPTGSYGVYELVGTNIKKVSTDAIDRVLNANRDSFAKGTFLYIGGHRGYYLSSYGLFYDVETGTWSYFTNGSYDNSFGPWSCWFTAGNYIFHAYSSTAGKPSVCTLSGTTYQEFGSAINVKVVTNEFDRSNRWKFIHEIDLISDKVNGTPLIRWTDNDFQSWSSSYSFNTSNNKSSIYRLGRTRRRSFEITHTDNTAFRAYYLEVDYDIGER